MADGEDRTEAASARRLQRARGEGNVPMSRELSALAVLATTALVLLIAAPWLATALGQRMMLFISDAHRLDPVAGLRTATFALLACAAPFVLASLLSGAAAVLLQTGFLINLSALLPDLGRLSPKRGLSRIAGVNTLLEAGKSVAKIGIVAWAGWHALSAMLPDLPRAMLWTPATLAGQALHEILQVMIFMLAAQAVITTLDMLWTRFKHARDLRMSRHDLRDEQRESDGDPQVKGKLKRLRAQRSRSRMMAAVPKATVVLTNPTHYAVALAYDRGAGGAPRVVAKGVDEVATRIRALATLSRVPVIANPPLARALYQVELDNEIPAEHYRTVAEIIAYVWRLRGRAMRPAR
jgi:flagellar biosynthetic protein FlhB